MLAQFAIQARLIFRQLWSFFRSHKKLGLVSFIIITSAIITSWFVFAPFAQAGWLSDVGETIGKAFAGLLFLLAGFCIKLTFFVLKFIIEVAGYNGFIDSPAVTVGWVMIRDLTNMFFVVVLLMIAFGTILGLDHYEWKHMLVKLVTAAVLVNFSRLICGLIIDVAQIVMVTFLNGIAATASGNLVNMFQVDKIFKLGNGDNFTGDTDSIFLASVAAIMFSVTMLITMLAFLFMIVARMAMLWVLIVVSPFAFVLNVLHQTEHFAGEWWGKFNSNVVSGPVIAFFLWLSFVTVGSGNIHDDIVKHNSLKQGQLLQESAAPAEEQTGITEVMSWENMGNFIIAIAILMAGAKMAEELGVAGAHMMGSASELGKKAAMYASGFQAAKWTASKGVSAVGKGLYYGTNMIPGLAGLHPEAWKRRAANIKSRAKGWYYDHKVESTVKAGEISKAFAVNKEGKFIKKTGRKIEKRDDKGNVVLGRDGQPIMIDEEVEQKGFMDWARRWAAKGRLEFGAGYDAFHHAYSEDLEATAEAKHEQLDHLASTSSLPIGLEKQKAKEWLEFLEHTGGYIKEGKKADMEALREKIMHIIEHQGKGEEGEKEVDKKLKDLGLSDLEIFKARQGLGRFNKSMTSKANAKVVGEYVESEHKKQEVKALEKYLDKNYDVEQKTAKLKSETKQIEDKIRSEKELDELKAIRKLLGEEKGKKAQQVILATQAELGNVKERADIEAEESVFRARAAQYARDRDEEKAEAYLRRADSLALEKSREATKNLTGDELIARIGFLAQQAVKARKEGDQGRLETLLQKLFVARSTAMNTEAWVGPAADRYIEQAIGMTADQKKDMTVQQYNLSLDAAKVCEKLEDIGDFAQEVEARLGEEGKGQAFLRDRRIAVENALVKSRRDVAGTIVAQPEQGRIKYSIVSSGSKDELEAKSEGEYKGWSKKVDLSTSAGAPISNLGRDSSGKIIDQALEVCKAEMDVFVGKLAGLTAQHFTRIPKVIEDLQNASEAVKKEIIAQIRANTGHNKDFVKQLAAALNV